MSTSQKAKPYRRTVLGQCIVPGCKSNSRNDPEIQMYKFPTDSSMQKVWLSTMGLRQSTLQQQGSRARVCCKHFEPKYIGKTKLKQIAIPTLNIPEVHHKYTIIAPSYSEESPAKSQRQQKREKTHEAMPVETTSPTPNNELIELIIENDKEHDAPLPEEYDELEDIELMEEVPIETENEVDFLFEDDTVTASVAHEDAEDEDYIKEEIMDEFDENNQHFEVVEIEPIDETTDELDCAAEDYNVIELDRYEIDITQPSPPSADVPEGKALPSGQLCIVPFCKTSYRDGPSVRMFKFPSIERDRKVWLSALGLSENVLKCLSVPRVCYQHFDPKVVGKKRLKQDAVPTINITLKKSKKLGALKSPAVDGNPTRKVDHNAGSKSENQKERMSLAGQNPSNAATCRNRSCGAKKKDQSSAYREQYARLLKQWEQTKLNHVKLYKRLRCLNVSIGKQKDLRQKFFIESRNRKMSVVLRGFKGLSQSSRTMCSMLLKKGINWNEDEKNLALCLHSSSPKLYYYMRNKFKMNLPSKSSMIRWNQLGEDI